MSKFLELRTKHRCFTYRNFSCVKENSRLKIQFHFIIDPEIEFKPTLDLPCPPEMEVPEHLIFNIGLIESISYWKSCCCPEYIIECGTLNFLEEIWWKQLFLNGLSEFFFTNKIELEELFDFSYTTEKTFDFTPTVECNGELILVGGGKDSALTMELLRDPKKRQAVFVLNSSKSSDRTIFNAGFTGKELKASRTIDAKLLELNKLGYLNGHTPFSAYLAFISTTTAYLNSFSEVILSNEASASETNTLNYKIPVNHQYSKSIEFEENFRNYLETSLNIPVNYYSFLRPLLETQIAALFSRYPAQLKDFRSCNVGQKEDRWCGECSKCAFVYLMLFPYLDSLQLKEIFGSDLFLRESIQNHIIALIDPEKVKPLECVGTRAESALSLKLAQNKIKNLPAPLTELLEKTEIDFGLIAEYWNSDNFLPSEKFILLRSLFPIIDAPTSKNPNN